MNKYLTHGKCQTPLYLFSTIANMATSYDSYHMNHMLEKNFKKFQNNSNKVPIQIQKNFKIF